MTSDAELMAATRRGDRDAFAQLVDRHKDALVGYLGRLTGCPERARDLAQDTFLRLYQRSARYEERGQCKALLYRIATNLVRSEQRRERRFRLLAPLLGRPAETAPDDGDPLLAREARSQVGRALSALPLRYRVPLVLHEIEGWSYADVARQLGCREGTVKSRVHRGRQRLKEMLAPYWAGAETGLAVAARENGELA